MLTVPERAELPLAVTVVVDVIVDKLVDMLVEVLLVEEGVTA
jgi:hypothetical protein